MNNVKHSDIPDWQWKFNVFYANSPFKSRESNYDNRKLLLPLLLLLLLLFLLLFLMPTRDKTLCITTIKTVIGGGLIGVALENEDSHRDVVLMPS